MSSLYVVDDLLLVVGPQFDAVRRSAFASSPVPFGLPLRFQPLKDLLAALLEHAQGAH